MAFLYRIQKALKPKVKGKQPKIRNASQDQFKWQGVQNWLHCQGDVNP